jgi:hypothetical protein
MNIEPKGETQRTADHKRYPIRAAVDGADRRQRPSLSFLRVRMSALSTALQPTPRRAAISP